VWIARIRGKQRSNVVIDAVDQATGLQQLLLLCTVFALNRSFADQHSKACHGASTSIFRPAIFRTHTVSRQKFYSHKRNSPDSADI